ncbi:RecX family transcriptional regulator [Marinomonas fungiae]
MGKQRILNELKQKGISEEQAKQALAHLMWIGLSWH